jgi:copper(I)-binding protein
VTLIFRRPILLVLYLAVLVASCGESGPPLTATGVVAFAPLPGSEVSAAYLTLHNHSQEALTIQQVSSPEFAKVEIHESMTVDDVIRMRRLDSLTLDAGTRTQFVSGGKHLMLIEPVSELAPGQSVTLQFEYNAGGILIVNTQLKTRI